MSRSFKKPYRGSKAVDISCRSHGSCPYCSSGRVYKKMRGLIEYDEGGMEEYLSILDELYGIDPFPDDSEENW